MKIPLIAKEVGAIGKDRKNVQQNYSFRGIDDVYNALHEAMAHHGVFSIPEVLDVKREERPSKSGGVLVWTVLTMKYTVFASDGSCIAATTVGEAMDSGDKGCNKAMSAAHKYFFLQLLTIPTEESKDTENETHKIASPQAIRQPMQGAKVITGISSITSSKARNSSGKEFDTFKIYGEGDIAYSTARKDFAMVAKTAQEAGLKVAITHKGDKYQTITDINVLEEEIL